METVNDIIAGKGKSVYSVAPESTLFEALELMADRNIGAVLVIDSNDQVQGIFSERDFVRKILIKGRSMESTRVKEVMTTHVLYVEPSTSIAECMTLMTEKRIRHLPVLSGGKPVGVISIGDVVKALLEQQEKLISQQAFEIGQLERYVTKSP
ncbi:MAG TPA: CBS domain-containing protein [Rectinemataceae bacterium]|nr:CBS domain-containing protein [Rectinemataceae bacterium]